MLLICVFTPHLCFHASSLFSHIAFFTFSSSILWTGIILFQSLFRRRLASKHTEHLRQKRMDACATKIQASWRSYTALTRFTWTVFDVVLVQSLARRWLAGRHVEKLMKENHQLQIDSATKIQAQWRGFSDYRDFMILLGGTFNVDITLIA